MKSVDPPRLFTERDLPDGLAASLARLKREELPSSDEISEIERGVYAAVLGSATFAGGGVGTSAGTGAGTAGAGTAGAHVGKVGILSKLLATKLGVFLVPAAIGASAGLVVGETGHRLQGSSGDEVASSGAPQPLRDRGVSADRRPSIDSKGPTIEDRTGPAPGALDEMRRDPTLPTPGPAGNVAAPRRAPVQAPSVPSLPDTSTSPHVADSPSIAALGEVDLIERAHRAMATDPKSAEVWLAEHERRFPNGTFVEEREAIAIDVLVREGATGDARARAARFFARFPGSAYAQRIEAILRSAANHKD